MTVGTLGRKREAERQRERDLNNLFAQVVNPFGSLHLFGARQVHLPRIYERELVGNKVPEMWRRGRLAGW